MRISRWLVVAAALLTGCGDDATQLANPPTTGPDGGADAALVDAEPGTDAADAEPGTDAADAEPGTDAGAAETGEQTYSCPIDVALTLQQTTVEALHGLLADGTPLHVIDVREPSETASGVIDGALMYPWTSGVLTADHESLPTGEPLYVICRSGNRSLPAATFLVEQGHPCVFNVQGGMNAWSAAGYETVLPQ